MADVADEAAMAALFERAAGILPPISCIAHAAAAVADGPLAGLDAERLDRVFRPKVEGARLLDRLSRGLPMRVFVLFSSVVSLLPSAGQGAYAAANAAVEHVARRRRALGLPAACIAWGPWNVGIGRSMGERAGAVWRSWGVEPLDAETGLALFDTLCGERADTLALAVDWKRYAAQAGTVPPLLSRLAPALDPKPATGTAAPLPATQGPPNFAALVATATARVLGLAGPDAVDPQRPFSEQGMDSLMATELAAALGEAVGRRLPGTLAYNHPTPATLAAHLSGKMPPEPIAPAEADDDPVDDDLLSQLERRLTHIDLLLEQTS
jgi:acyl carrier protein